MQKTGIFRFSKLPSENNAYKYYIEETKRGMMSSPFFVPESRATWDVLLKQCTMHIAHIYIYIALCPWLIVVGC